MTSMAGMFMLMGACIYVVGRLSLEDHSAKGLWLMCLGLVGGTILSAACKENAVLLPVYIGVLELTLLSQLRTSQHSLKKVRWFFVIFVGLPILSGLFYWSQHPGFITSGYGGRPFTFLERVLTEPRVLWFLVGHSLESTVFPLEVIHEHRNYLPAFGPLLGLTYLLLFALANKIPNGLRIALVAIIVFCLGFGTFNRAQYWSSESALIESLAINHPDSPSSQYLRGEILRKREKDFEGSYAYYLRAAELSPEEAGFLISLSMVTPKSFTELESQLGSLQLARADYIESINRNNPMGAWGIRALDVAIKCVMSGNQRYLSKADDVASWLQALIDKSNGKSAHRYYSLVHLFAIRMKQNRFADALIGLKRLDEAEKLLNDIKNSSAGRVRKYATRIKQLKSAIQLIRLKAAKP